VIALTGEQIRAGRALARIEQTTLAEITGLSLETIKRVERIRGPVNVNLKTLNAITAALGIVFDSHGGLRTTYGGPPSPDDHDPLERLIYGSVASHDPAKPVEAVLKSIVAVSTRRNALLGVTGVLLASPGEYLQVLEGPSENLSLLYAAISTDPRHKDVRLLERAEIDVRAFGSWTMRAGVVAAQDQPLLHEAQAQQQTWPEPRTESDLLRLVRTMDARLAAPI
jgi:transcriptional regulator with XRE-family HTH domain